MVSILGLPLKNPHPPSRDAPAYPALSILDIIVFVFHSLYIISQTCPLHHNFSTSATTILYLLILPLELLFESSPYHTTTNSKALVHDGTWSQRHNSSSCCTRARMPRISLLQDLTIRLCRHAHQSFPQSIIRAFFSEVNVLPLFVSRMGGANEFDRHCAKLSSAPNGSTTPVEGWWVSPNRAQFLVKHTSALAGDEKPDIIIMYLHGGGYTFCGPSFYIEMLYRICVELQARGFKRPAIFAPVYGLAPEHTFPYQMHRALDGWNYICETVGGESCPIGIGGDSAGGGLAVALMLKIAENCPSHRSNARKPDFATLISPWSSILELPSSRNLSTDFLDPTTLSNYAHTYTSAQPSFIDIDATRNLSTFLLRQLSRYCHSITLINQPYSTPHDILEEHHQRCKDHPLASPLDVWDPDGSWWHLALPPGGLLVAYSSREILAEDCERLVHTLRNAETTHSSDLTRRGNKQKGSVVRDVTWDFCHAPVVVHCFLGRDHQERAYGVQTLADFIRGAV